MSLKNTEHTYGRVAKTLHWLIAFAVLGLLIVGLVMADMERSDFKFQLYGIHKSLGMTVLVLMIARLGWKIMNWGTPTPNEHHQKWERTLALVMHWGLYALVIAMPLSGWLMSAAGGHPVNWFGLFSFPAPVGESKALGGLMRDVHEFIGFGLWGVIGLHVAGTLKHMFIDKDDTLQRMFTYKRKS